MNLELVETKCVNYLKQTQNPLVPVSILLSHLRQDALCSDITEQELLEFLRPHELFKVVEPPDRDEEEIEDLDAVGIPSGPRVILNTRVPTPAEISDLLGKQMQTMTDALYRALAEATQSGDTESCERISEILSRAEQLQQQIEDVLP
jgi:hypothetical protein